MERQTDRKCKDGASNMAYCYTTQSNKDARTHTHKGAQTDGFGTSKASQRLTKCEATRRKSKLFSFPHHAEGGDTPTLYFPI